MKRAERGLRLYGLSSHVSIIDERKWFVKSRSACCCWASVSLPPLFFSFFHFQNCHLIINIKTTTTNLKGCFSSHSSRNKKKTCWRVERGKYVYSESCKNHEDRPPDLHLHIFLKCHPVMKCALHSTHKLLACFFCVFVYYRRHSCAGMYKDSFCILYNYNHKTLIKHLHWAEVSPQLNIITYMHNSPPFHSQLLEFEKTD